MPTKVSTIEIDMQTLDDVLRRAETALSEEDYDLLKCLAESYAYLTELVGDKNTSLARLRKLLFGAGTEKTAAVLGGKNASTSSPVASSASPATAVGEGMETASSSATNAENTVKTPRKGHGRNPSDAYAGAEKIVVTHESLQPGDACPKCERRRNCAALIGLKVQRSGLLVLSLICL